jgi:MbtH protein
LSQRTGEHLVHRPAPVTFILSQLAITSGSQIFLVGGDRLEDGAGSYLNFPVMDETEDKTIYRAVVNHEEQYSIWPAHKENPLGWNDAGKTGTKSEVLAHIKEVWTDMRPLSLRKKMEEDALRRSANDQ